MDAKKRMTMITRTNLSGRHVFSDNMRETYNRLHKIPKYPFGKVPKYPNTHGPKNAAERLIWVLGCLGTWVFYYLPTRNMISRINGSSWLGRATLMVGLNGSGMSFTM